MVMFRFFCAGIRRYFILAFIFFLINACKKDKSIEANQFSEPSTDQFLCDGNGSDSYYPLELYNKWIYNSHHNNIEEHTVTVTQTYHSKVYYKITPGFIGIDYLREDLTTHDIYAYSVSADSEYLFIPGNPVLNQILQTPTLDTLKVVSINANYTTEACSYTGVLKIFCSHPGRIFKWYYKKGVGLIYFEDTGLKEFKILNSITLH